MTQPRFLREADVERAVTPACVVAAVAAAQRDLGMGLAWNEPRRRLRMPGGVLHMMAAAWPAKNVFGYKAYTSFRDGPRFLVHAFDLNSGAPVAVAEAARLGQLRTGAATAVAVNHLANPAPAGGSTLALVGAGYQAWGQLECIAAVRPLAEVRVASRTAATAEGLVQRAREQLRLDARAARAEEAVRGADIVVTATTSSEPVVKDGWLAPGATVCGVGANGLMRREIDVRTLARAAAIVVDDLEPAKLESGALTAAVEANRFHWEQARTLGAVLAGRAPGRQRPDELVVFLSHGLGLWDVASMAAALERVDVSKLPAAYPG